MTAKERDMKEFVVNLEKGEIKIRLPSSSVEIVEDFAKQKGISVDTILHNMVTGTIEMLARGEKTIKDVDLLK